MLRQISAAKREAEQRVKEFEQPACWGGRNLVLRCQNRPVRVTIHPAIRLDVPMSNTPEISSRPCGAASPAEYHWPESELYVSQQHRLVYCPIQKVACSS